jgi:hypothetical protein
MVRARVLSRSYALRARALRLARERRWMVSSRDLIGRWLSRCSTRRPVRSRSRDRFSTIRRVRSRNNGIRPTAVRVQYARQTHKGWRSRRVDHGIALRAERQGHNWDARSRPTAPAAQSVPLAFRSISFVSFRSTTDPPAPGAGHRSVGTKHATVPGLGFLAPNGSVHSHRNRCTHQSAWFRAPRVRISGR